MKKFIAILIIALSLGCDDYLDIQEKGKKIPETVEDLNLLMNDYNKFIRSSVNVLFVNDEVKLYEDEVSKIFWGGVERFLNGYQWRDHIYDNPDDNDGDWNSFYAQIYICNVVLDRIDEAEGDDVGLRNMTKGEALAQRAYAYFMLVNTYGKHYNQATSASDLGVPLYTEPDVNNTKGRATVQEVYDLIEGDLQEALTLLPPEQEYPYHPSQAGVHGLLSKIYLYKGMWEEALDHADYALSINSELYNFNDYDFIPGAPKFAGLLGFPRQTWEHKEILWTKKVDHPFVYGIGVYMSDEHLSLYDEGDRRLYFRHIEFHGYGANDKGPIIYSKENYYKAGINTPELYLIRAECNARLNRPDLAITDLNTLRQARFDLDKFVPYATGMSNSEALALVFKERRVELFLEPWRWFDLKRLNLEPEHQTTLTRTFNGTTYSLSPESNNYIIAIPKKVINLNPKVEQNPRGQ
ncbi:MAG: RagB/SusD family nutrient uptake outer membrane protein [Algicola sp.]|nr:RagB/SusD family nutrient uptake outer membrane protein [Algicola sp.]